MDESAKPPMTTRKIVAEGFLIGFFSTLGMMAAFSVVQNRERIKSAVKVLTA